MAMPCTPRAGAALGPEVRWVLRRAFGPPHQPFPDPVDGGRAADLAGDLGLVERIGARVPSTLLVAELGREVARRLALSRLQVLARVEGLCELVPELASLAAAASIPIVLLKFAALRAGGYLAEGSRAAGDIDVLLREDDTRRAAEILARRGFHAAEMTMADHHLPPLQDRRGRVVELHTRLPGLRAPGDRRFASFERLEEAGALESAPGLGSACHLLGRDLMVAHAVAHGLAHHGGADAYPVTRMLADVIDLLPGERRTRGIRCGAWIADAVPPSELDAVLGLCDGLEKGDLDGLHPGGTTGRQGELLRHVLDGALDADYHRSLIVGYLFRPLSDRPRWWKVLKLVQWAVVPTRTQLAVRLGLPSARHVDVRLRLAHAAGLARRLPALGRAALRVGWQRLRAMAYPGAIRP